MSRPRLVEMQGVGAAIAALMPGDQIRSPPARSPPFIVLARLMPSARPQCRLIATLVQADVHGRRCPRGRETQTVEGRPRPCASAPHQPDAADSRGAPRACRTRAPWSWGLSPGAIVCLAYTLSMRHGTTTATLSRFRYDSATGLGFRARFVVVMRRIGKSPLEACGFAGVKSPQQRTRLRFISRGVHMRPTRRPAVPSTLASTIAFALAASTSALPVFAQQAADAQDEGKDISRSSLPERASPIDPRWIPPCRSTSCRATPCATAASRELNQALAVALPSLNFPRPGLADGTDTIRPATLRGLSPDQTLVLLNSKRRHPASLVNLNQTIGRGAAAVDLNTIPTAAVQSIEVLRDGASAQYGSDAIAGVINVRLKEARDGGDFTATYGQYESTYDGAGRRPCAGRCDLALPTVLRAQSFGWRHDHGVRMERPRTRVEWLRDSRRRVQETADHPP